MHHLTIGPAMLLLIASQSPDALPVGPLPPPTAAPAAHDFITWEAFTRGLHTPRALRP